MTLEQLTKGNKNETEFIVEMELDFLENYFEEEQYVSDFVQKKQPISDTY